MEELLALFEEDEEKVVAIHLSGGTVPYSGLSQENGEDGPEWAVRGLEWAERAPMRGEGNAAELYAKVNAGRLRSEAPESSRLVVQAVERGNEAYRSIPADARALDREFRRDARRYDGGLSLL